MEYLGFCHYLNLYHHWKTSLIGALQRYLEQAQKNLASDDSMHLEIKQALRQLSGDQLMLAFVSDDATKSFKKISDLLLPNDDKLRHSQLQVLGVHNFVIRFNSKNNQRSKLKLLPIETCVSALSLAEWRARSEQWTELELNSQNTVSFAEACQHLGDTKTMTRSQAVALGLPACLFSLSGENVEMPAWRYAELCLSLPFLAQDLSLVFLCGKSGVPDDNKVAKDILTQGNCSVFSVTETAFVPSGMRRHWSQWNNRSNKSFYLGQLILSEEKLTSIARSTNDDSILKSISEINLAKKSQAQEIIQASDSKPGRLSHQIGEVLVQHQVRAFAASTLGQTFTQLLQHKNSIQNRRERLCRQKFELEILAKNSEAHLNLLLKDCERAKGEHDSLAENVGPSAQLLKKQTDLLLTSISPEIVNRQVEELKKQLVSCTSTRGIKLAMQIFKKKVYSNFIEFGHEVALAQKLAHSMQQKLLLGQTKQIHQANKLQLNHFNQRLRSIFRRAERWHRRVVMTLSEHSLAVKRYFSETVKAILAWYRDLRKACLDWYRAIISPLTQGLHQQKKYLTQRIEDLKDMQQNGSTIQGRIRGTSLLVSELDAVLQAGDALISRLLPVAQAQQGLEFEQPEILSVNHSG